MTPLLRETPGSPRADLGVVPDPHLDPLSGAPVGTYARLMSDTRPTGPHDSDGPQDVVPGAPRATSPSDALPVIRPDGLVHPAHGAGHGESGTSVAGLRPGGHPAEPPPETRIVTVFGDARRSGRYRLAIRTSAFLLFGDLVLDLREAVLETDVVEVRADTLFGDVRLVVPPGVEVRVQNTAVFSDSTVHPSTTVAPHTHTVVVRGLAVFGDVTVYTVNPGDPVPTLWNRLKNRLGTSRRPALGS